MPGPLIVNPDEAKAELSANDPATKKEVMLYVANHHRMNVIPGIRAVAEQMTAIAKRYDLGALIVNDLLDFLEIEGFQIQKDGRVRLNAQEFATFRKRRAEKGRTARNDA